MFCGSQLTGLSILTVGAFIESTYHHYGDFVGECVRNTQLMVDYLTHITYKRTHIGSYVWSAPIMLIVVGALVFIIAFVGCCGAVKESSCMVLSVSTTAAIRSPPTIPNRIAHCSSPSFW